MALLLPLTSAGLPHGPDPHGRHLFQLQLWRVQSQHSYQCSGDAANSATMMDGFPMTENAGQWALGMSATAVGRRGGIGVILLVFSAPIIAIFALRFGAAETCFWPSCPLDYAAMVVGSPAKGLISAGIGLFLATVGYDRACPEISASPSESLILRDELQLIPVVVGVFAFPAITLGELGGTSPGGNSPGASWRGSRATSATPPPFCARSPSCLCGCPSAAAGSPPIHGLWGCGPHRKHRKVSKTFSCDRGGAHRR